MKRLVAAAVVVAACGGGSERVIVAAGTTLVDSGLMAEVAAVYEAAHPGVRVSVVGESTLRVLELGRSGTAEVLITHAPSLTDEWVATHGAESDLPLMTGRFVLLGPAHLVDEVAGGSFTDAFAAIAAGEFRFVGRDDDSGTSLAEAVLWEAAGVEFLEAGWYSATGQGMGATLQIAHRREAFVLSDRGAWLQSAPNMAGTLVVAVAQELPNPYRVIVVSGASPEARALAAWLAGEDGAAALEAANRAVFGEVAYRPAAVSSQPAPSP